MNNTEFHVHAGNYCNGDRYLAGDVGDYYFVQCPRTHKSPLLKQLFAEPAPECKRPRCQQSGCISRATVMVGWVQNSYFKVFCDQHAQRRPKGYYVAKLIGVDQ